MEDPPCPAPRLLGRFRASLAAFIGDVAFGMEDGAVSIAGLVLGVAASTQDSWIVALAGARREMTADPVGTRERLVLQLMHLGIAMDEVALGGLCHDRAITRGIGQRGAVP